MGLNVIQPQPDWKWWFAAFFFVPDVRFWVFDRMLGVRLEV